MLRDDDLIIIIIENFVFLWLLCVSRTYFYQLDDDVFCFFVSSFCVSFFSLSFFFFVAKNSALLLNEKEISFVPSFKRRDLVSLFFCGGQRVLHPLQLEILSLTNIIMFALTTQFAGVQVVSKTNAPKKSVNKVVSVSNKVFSHVVYPPRSREKDDDAL